MFPHFPRKSGPFEERILKEKTREKEKESFITLSEQNENVINATGELRYLMTLVLIRTV